MHTDNTTPHQWQLNAILVRHTEAMRDALRDGWEPFAVEDGRMWFRRLTLYPDSSSV